jgi:hypothetical protein
MNELDQIDKQDSERKGSLSNKTHRRRSESPKKTNFAITPTIIMIPVVGDSY